MRQLTVCSLSVLLVACGGGGGGGAGAPATATGYFKDSNTQGVRYVSGTQTGVTGTDGSFTYEVGKPVNFAVGGVDLGTVTVGKSVVTPVDLVPNGTTTSQAVQNLTRFLMMLDADQNPANGIQISQPVQTAAANWAPVDFNQTEVSFATAAGAIVSAAATVDQSIHTLPTATAAKTHVESTLRCARSGGFKGVFDGTIPGRFAVLVEAKTGNIMGFGYDAALQSRFFSIAGNAAVALDQTATFGAGVAATGATWSGRQVSPDAIEGTWTNTGQTGKFSGTRVGGALNAQYRFTGRFQSSESTPVMYGLYTFDIDGSNKVSGIAYNVAADAVETLTGTVNGTALSGSTSSGMTYTATIDLPNGTVTSATWQKSPLTGSFTADGCKLN